MAFKKIEQVKKDKGFRLFDLIIYGAIIAIVAVLFITLFFTRNTQPLEGIRILVKEQAVFEYSFENDELGVVGDGVEVDREGVITVRISLDDGDFNVVEIDPAARTAKVTQANCKNRDCVYTAAITSANGIIYCSPHRVRIEPLNYKNNDGDHVII